MEIKIGTVGTAGRTVTEKDTALAVKSGSLQVLATPVLSALMEEAAVAALAPLPAAKTDYGRRFHRRPPQRAHPRGTNDQSDCHRDGGQRKENIFHHHRV